MQNDSISLYRLLMNFFGDKEQVLKVGPKTFTISGKGTS